MRYEKVVKRFSRADELMLSMIREVAEGLIIVNERVSSHEL